MNKKKLVGIIVACVVIGIVVSVVVNRTNPGPTEDEKEYAAYAWVYVMAAANQYDDFVQVTGSNSTLDRSAKIDKAIDCKRELEKIKAALSATQYPASLREAHQAARDFVRHLVDSIDCYLDAYSAFDNDKWSTGFDKFDQAKTEQEEAIAAFCLFDSLVDVELNGS